MKKWGFLMDKTSIEALFDWLDQTTEMVKQHTNEPYLDSLTISMKTLFYRTEFTIDNDEMLTHKLQTALKNIDLTSYSREEIRKAIQLVILKGMHQSTQPQHLITPEAVSLLVGYLVNKFMKGRDHVRIFDPAVGTAHLLTTVLQQLDVPWEAFASEVDPTLIQLGVLNANLQKLEIEFFHQDSLAPFLLDPVDLVVADLPVGYYPDDVRADDFDLKASEGHSYAHHLFIEQSIRYSKAGGYIILLIPEFLFDSDQSEQLHSYLQKNAHIVGVLRLPDSSFKSKQNIKSILVLQKKGEKTQSPNQPLLVHLPSLSNTVAMEDILGQMNQWFTNYYQLTKRM